MLRSKKQDIEEGESHNRSDEGDDDDPDGKRKHSSSSSSSPSSPIMEEATNNSFILSFLHVFSLDLRSLALFRVMLGLTVLIDSILRSTNTFSHYANLGVWPVVEAILSNDSNTFSLNFINGNTSFQFIIFTITCLVSLLVIIGYKTRITTCLLWGLVVSIHNRNVLVLNSGDDFLRLLLFWSMFLPLGARYSVDMIIDINPPPPKSSPSSFSPSPSPSSHRYLAPASFALIVQFVCFYWVGYILKTGVEWEESTALYYALSIDQYTTAFGYFLLRFPSLLSFLTQVYLFLELLLPFLICSPFAHGLVRTIAVVLMVLFHFGVGLSLDLGLYTWAPMLGALSLLPSWFWDYLLGAFITPLFNARHHSRFIVLYYDADVPVIRTLLSITCTFLGVRPSLTALQTNGEGQGGEDSVLPILGLMRDGRYYWVAVDSTGRRLTGHNAVLALLYDTPALSLFMPIISRLSVFLRFGYFWSALLFSILPLEYLLAPPQYPLVMYMRALSNRLFAWWINVFSREIAASDTS